jgi:hypothetical protein
MIAEVKGARLLQGFRGRPAADLEALADTLVRVSYLAMHLDGHLAELDINPLMVLPSRSGSEGGRRPRHVSRHIAPHVAESLTRKFARPNCRQQRTALEPTTAAFPWRREPPLMPHTRHSQNRRDRFSWWRAAIRSRQLRWPRYTSLLTPALPLNWTQAGVQLRTSETAPSTQPGGPFICAIAPATW